jgi:hypothetical protein
MRPQRHHLAELETGGAIDDHFVMVAQDVASGHQALRTARSIQFVADEEKTKRLAVEFGLHRLISHRAGVLDAVDARHDLPGVAGNARCFGERAVGSGLDHPKVRVRRARLAQRVVDQSAIDTGYCDDDAKQQAQAETRQHETQQIVPDVAVGEIHRFGSLATAAARPTLRPLRNGATTMASTDTPPVIS